jgi:hypothetical protein
MGIFLFKRIANALSHDVSRNFQMLTEISSLFMMQDWTHHSSRKFCIVRQERHQNPCIFAFKTISCKKITPRLFQALFCVLFCILFMYFYAFFMHFQYLSFTNILSWKCSKERDKSDIQPSFDGNIQKKQG